MTYPLTGFMVNPSRAPRRQRGGFTLVHLLVVIVILVFMLAVLICYLLRDTEAARRSQCNNNLKQIGLGLQNYADVNKCFPYDALWGSYPNNDLGISGNTKQSAYHYPWSVQILPFIEAQPVNLIDKRIAIWNQSQQYGTGGVPVTNPPAYFGYVQSFQIPPYRCPSDVTFTGPGDLPSGCMWTNYAGSVGVGFYSAVRRDNAPAEGKSHAPWGTKGFFTFNEPATFAMIKDGTSQTIAVAEVTASSVAAPTTAATMNFNGDLRLDLPFAANSNQPLPQIWGLPRDATPWSPGTLLAGGTGKKRASLPVSPNGSTRVPMVFRSAMIALTESVTGSGPCSLADTYAGAQGGACGQPVGPNAVPGFELAGAVGQSVIVGISPLYNALYSPNSNWPGPDSNHPNVVLVVFGDGHTLAALDSIQFQIWASLHSRQGGEALRGEF